MNALVKLPAVSAARPFPGLRPFAYQDHDFFFGRQDQIYALYRLIDRSRFIAVVGSSGSGKSSLVRAGLLPLLDVETRETGGRHWVWREMRPGDAPLSRLTNLLASLSSDDDPNVASGRRDRITAQLNLSSFGISEALAEADNLTGKSVVLVIDQFEELFRYAAGSSGKTGLTAETVRMRDEATQFVQLLLEASRNPSVKAHILLTMRSDFIGDCARFHGLPEAVCEAQFLVPSPTRDQLDEVIRAPIEKAGASISPYLVERLLNDCSTAIDQLPVLQHCLSRLWDEAGKTVRPDAPLAGSRPADGKANHAEQPVRQLLPEHYVTVGEFTGALSQHADEVLQDMPGSNLQLAVGQIFSALSELDKEGRATRRALQFSQLVAETGIDEAIVCRVLDRFRADDCSFLTPSFFEVQTIKDHTRIDVGHEALLRRWDKVGGHGTELGWLRAEQQAGERYRGLLAMAEGVDAVLPPHLVDERWAWWTARPRTPAWADRYGGGFSRVADLLLRSRRRQNLKRVAIAATFAAAVCVAAAMTVLWRTASNAEVAARTAQEDANRRREQILNANRISIGRLAGFLNDGTIRAVGAQKFLEDVEATLRELSKQEGHSLQSAPIEISLLLAASDAKDAVGDYKGASDLARGAESIAQSFVDKYPDDLKLKRLLYGGKFRVGDQLAKTPGNPGSAASAEGAYRDAVALARQLQSREPDNPEHQHSLIVALNKVGDIYQYRRDWPVALQLYNEGLQIAQSIATTFPGDVATEKNRLAQIYSARNQLGDRQLALDHYREALNIQIKELDASPDDSTFISHVAVTHRRIGELLGDNSDEAQRAFEAAINGHKKLYQRDPGNIDWCDGLATDHIRLGDVLLRKQDWRGALVNYDEGIRIAGAIISNKPESTRWQRNLAALNSKRGDALLLQANELIFRPEPPREQSLRVADGALAGYRASAQYYEGLLKLSNSPQRELFDVRLKIGNILTQQNDFQGALDVYGSASDLALQAAANRRVVDWQMRLANAIMQAGDLQAGKIASADAPSVSSLLPQIFYQKALEVIDASAAKEPDNQDVKTLKASLDAKIGPR